ncbi:MAG: hypothetical protein N2043_01565 [Ignavibacterium sp.]|nr:hypothetical protein [Ignavibacterium sp.]
MIEFGDVPIPFLKDEKDLKKDFEEFMKMQTFMETSEPIGELPEGLQKMMNKNLIERNNLMYHLQKTEDEEKENEYFKKLKDNVYQQLEIWNEIYTHLNIPSDGTYYYNPVDGKIYRGYMDVFQ